MPLVAPTFNRLNFVKLKKVKPSNFLLASRLKIYLHSTIRFRAIIRRQLAPSGVLPSLPATNANVRYLFNEASILSSRKYPTSLATTSPLLGCLLRENDTRPSISLLLFRLFLFSFPFFLLFFFFCPFSRAEVTPARRHATDPLR